MNPNCISREVGPHASIEEFLFDGVTSFQGSIAFLVLSITDNMPTKTELDVFISRQLDELHLAVRSLWQSIRLCDNANSPQPFRIQILGHVEDGLICEIILGRDNCQNDAPLVLHIGANHSSDLINIVFGLGLVLGMN